MSNDLVFGSVCSGIEAASVAWNPLGWQAAFVSDIDPFARAVLKHRHPNTPLHGDFTTIGKSDYEKIDLLVGGTPCQSFSIAGLRGGMDDDRGNLALEYVRLAQRLQPQWLVWENVPGVLSADKGRALGSILGALAEVGYGFAYRVLDAQFFGVPQRRRRLFLVGYLGDWRPPAAVLFESQSLCGSPTPSRKAGSCSPTLTSSGAGVSRIKGAARSDDTEWIECVFDAVSGTLCASAAGLSRVGGGAAEPDFYVEDRVTGTLCSKAAGVIGVGGGAAEPSFYVEDNTLAFSCKDSGTDAGPMSPTLRAMNNVHSHMAGGGQVAIVSPTLTAYNMDSRSPQSSEQQQIVAAVFSASSSVRRLTPVECERLQGFPDNYTLVPYTGGKLAKDAPRYCSIGNSMAVPVMNWIGSRIAMVNELL